MASQGSKNGVALQRPTPTRETQELYDAMRREEERLTPESLSQIPAWENRFSDPLSTSRPLTSPTSPSYDTLSQATAETGVSDPQRAKKPRPGRKGPLPQAKKLRAALLRKLRACDECRERRVRCAHFDFSLFEDAYQACKQQENRLVDADPHDTRARSQRPRLGDAADLLGVGLGQSRPLYSSSAVVPWSDSAVDEVSPDTDPLWNQQNQLQPYVTFSNFQEPEPRHLFPVVPASRSVTDLPLSRQTAGALPSSRSATSLPSLRLTAANLPTSRPADALPLPPRNNIALGKQLSAGSDWWLCLWGHGDQPASLREPVPVPCNGQFRGLEALKTHFGHEHGVFYQDWHLWKCVECELELSKPPDPGRPCPMCGQAESLGWNAWYYARV
ncbi:hypothetical protein N657DRAFT_357739 [Parathielavia appendiculata]|uniref:Uncharacterized protein n=1 Tax=Parathielavia appendiculata TaxID=2587402 RepID=A0AAN6U2A6_9PEZI|nr:hypothetical protein N657DRAFT_357739 [Parathielavia appendiculata]